MSLALAWLTPLLLGAAALALLGGRPRSLEAWQATLGGGCVLGLLLCAAAVGALGSVPTTRILPILLPLLLGVAALAMARLAWRGPLWAAAGSSLAWPSLARQRAEPVRPGQRLLAVFLLALLAAHAWLVATEVLLRPPYPWDAWAIWLLKPKAWMLAGRIDGFVGFEQWLGDASGQLRTADAWNYPDAIAHLGIWLAAAWGEWNAVVVTVAWLVLWLALLLGCHGHLRGLGLASERALIAVYALGSLPLINAHVALAGYADLWIASALAFACLYWLRWLELRRHGDLLAALAFAVLLPSIKLEGTVWLVLFASAALYAHLPARLQRFALVAVPLLGGVVVLAYWFHWPLIGPALERLGLRADSDALLAAAPGVIAAAITGLFAQYNWHLFGFAVLLSLVLRWRGLRQSPSLRLFGLFLLLGCAFLFVLFVLTPAGRWAESYTAVNRLGMQIVPSMLLFAALLWREPHEAEQGDAVTPSMVAWAASGR